MLEITFLSTDIFQKFISIYMKIQPAHVCAHEAQKVVGRF